MIFQLKRWLTGLALASTLCTLTLADDKAVFWPGSEYDASIPTIRQVLGYESGERISSHGNMLRYFEALQQAAPDRIKLVEYGRTWEGRSLIYAAIGKPDYLDQLDAFASRMQLLANPDKTDLKQANKLMAELPASVWLAYGVHGNEISSTDAAMMTAYHLLAAPDEATNKKILGNTIVFIDPAQNPDGRVRFTSRYYATVGLEHSADRISAEHNEPWPRGRTNHYLFDMNRDWLAVTQPETAGRIKALNHYMPLVVIDLHEMGSDSSYYFAPAAEPFNPFMTKTQIDNMNVIGRNHGKYFDRFGYDFFTREVYDAFYPGYGDSWPTFYGASASTYEVASTRGERFKKANGDLYSYRDSVHQHFITSISTAEGVSVARDKLLKDFYQYQVNAIESGRKDDERVFILPNTRDRAGNHRLATLMAQHGVKVIKATEPFKACGKSYQKGAYVLDTAQPRGRYLKVTFTDQVDMADDFVKEQERRRARKLNDEIYDVTGWSLPLMFNIDKETCGRSVKVAGEVVNADDRLSGLVTNADAKVAYIVAWGDMAAGRFLTAALREGITVKSADKAFQLEDKSRFPAGSLIIEQRTNGADLAQQIQRLADQTGALVTGVDSSWVIDGPSFGSSKTVTMKAPRVALAWDNPTSSLSAGNARFVIERQFNYPVTVIRTTDLGSVDLSEYQVLILPNGSYSSILDKSAAEHLDAWVTQGGVLITFAGATNYVASQDAGLLDVDLENAYKQSSESDKDSKKDLNKDTVDGQIYTSKADLMAASENAQEKPDFVAGVLANIEVDQEHWLTAGVNQSVVGMVYGRDIYSPIKLKSGKNLAWFAGPDEVLASGYLWQENKKQLAYKPYLIHQPKGQGMIIGYTQDPTVRAYLDGLNVMLMNSIFRAAAHAG